MYSKRLISLAAILLAQLTTISALQAGNRGGVLRSLFSCQMKQSKCQFETSNCETSTVCNAASAPAYVHPNSCPPVPTQEPVYTQQSVQQSCCGGEVVLSLSALCPAICPSTCPSQPSLTSSCANAVVSNSTICECSNSDPITYGQVSPALEIAPAQTTVAPQNESATPMPQPDASPSDGLPQSSPVSPTPAPEAASKADVSLEPAKAEIDRNPIETPSPNKANDEAKIAAEKIAAEKIAEEKLAAEKLAAEKLAEEKLAAEKLAEEKLAAEKLAAQKLAEEKLAAEKLAMEEKLAAENKAKREQAEKEQLVKERLEKERTEAERLASEKTKEQPTAPNKVPAPSVSASIIPDPSDVMPEKPAVAAKSTTSSAAIKPAPGKAAAGKDAAGKSSQAPPKPEMMLTVKSIQIADKTPKGEQWDNGSDADIRISLTAAGVTVTTPVGNDKNALTLDRDVAKVKVGYIVQIDASDTDVLFDDPIGTTKYTITEDDFAKKSISLSFDSVTSMVLELSK